MQKGIIFTLFALLFNLLIFSQHKKSPDLKKTIESIISNKKADVGVSILGTDQKETIQINGNTLYPMLSTVKFPIALTVLKKVEKGELSLQQKLFIKKEELLEDTWSPFKKEHPEGNIEISLEEALKWIVSYSDNNISDILMRLVGGSEPVQQLVNSKDCIIQNNEEDMHKDWESQFVNKITPNEAIRLLTAFSNGKILNKEHSLWLYNIMLNNTAGPKRLKGNLPPQVKVAHRTGTSFTNKEGMTGAINDFGIIELSDNKKIYIAVFVHDTNEKFENAEAIIADISKATYDYYHKK
ncbi:class A beta-lactamase [Chryseobacterium sp. JV274]|jgi:beta-lactamase class A|uniref:class A beta-lactamase n=1 Tax=unclassified Chryseobacterium TaxID=2593645 RepID=UPI0015C1C7C5|nr:class A beta-lactamase [Chryseobacterium sp. JV274]CAD0219951.1 Beta-lactamase [Chryseobacterium sp. JV274]